MTAGHQRQTPPVVAGGADAETFLGDRAGPPQTSTGAEYERVLAALSSAGRQYKRQGDGSVMAQCPAHPDRTPSLHVSRGDKGVVLHCHAGCDTGAVLDALGLTASDLFDRPGGRAATVEQRPEEYIYTDAQGETLYMVRRYYRGGRKHFGQYHPDGRGGWAKGLNGAQPTLYRLPVLSALEAGSTVYVAEGEKCVHALERADVTATTNSGGAGKWPAGHAHYFADRHVIVCADNDAPGRRHAAQVADDLAPVAASVTVVQAPGGHHDVADMLAAGLPLDALVPVDRTDDIDGVAVRTVTTVPASEFDPENVVWLWPDRVPFGHITMVDGPPNTGKSTLVIDLAARFTRGDTMPDGTPSDRTGGSVVILTAEDDPATTSVPRLMAAGADLTRVHFAVDTRTGDTADDIVLPGDVPALHRLVDSLPGPVIVIVDVLVAYLDSRTDAAKDAQVRQVMRPLFELAKATGCAIIALRHHRKEAGGNAINAGGGSIAFTGSARAAHYVVHHPDDDADDPDHRRVFGVAKCNIGRPVPPIVYRVAASTVHSKDGTPVTTSHIVWSDETVTVSQSDLIGGTDPAERTERTEAIDWLQDHLDGQGPLRSNEVKKAAAQAGISDRTLQRARAAIRVQVAQDSDEKGRTTTWSWTSPEGGSCQGHATVPPPSGSLAPPPPAPPHNRSSDPSCQGRATDPPDSLRGTTPTGTETTPATTSRPGSVQDPPDGTTWATCDQCGHREALRPGDHRGCMITGCTGTVTADRTPR